MESANDARYNSILAFAERFMLPLVIVGMVALLAFISWGFSL